MGATNTSQDWKNDYELLQQNQLYPCKKIVRQKMRDEKYSLLTVNLTDEEQIQKMIIRLKYRDQVNSKYVVPFEKVYHFREQNMCGNSMKFDLVYEYTENYLSDHFYHRKNHQERFNYSQVMYIIFNTCSALKDIKLMQDCHGKITMKSIAICRDVKLTDPITEQIGEMEASQYRKSRISGYPSPATLFNRIDSGMNLDTLKEDLFSIGIIALQLLNMESDIKNVYKSQSKSFLNIKIDFDAISNKIDKIQHNTLRRWVQILLQSNSESRLNIFKQLEDYRINQAQIKFIREKPKALTPEQQLVEEQTPVSFGQPEGRYPRPHLAFQKNQHGNTVNQNYSNNHSAPKIIESRVVEHQQDKSPHGKKITFNTSVPAHHISVPAQHPTLSHQPSPQLVQTQYQYQPLPKQIKYQKVEPISVSPPKPYTPPLNSQPLYAVNTRPANEIQSRPNIRYTFNDVNNRVQSAQKQKIEPTYFPPERTATHSKNYISFQQHYESKRNTYNTRTTAEQQLALPFTPYHSNYKPYHETSFLNSNYLKEQPTFVSKSPPLAQQKHQERPVNSVPTPKATESIPPQPPQLNEEKPKNIEEKPLVFDEQIKKYDKIIKQEPTQSIKQIAELKADFKRSSSSQIKPSDSKKSIEIKKQLEKELEEFQKITKENEKLSKIINSSANKVFTTSTLPIPEEPLAETGHDQSKISDASFVIQNYEDGSKYQGFISDQKRNGYGKFFYQAGGIYDGEWRQNHMNGYGTLFYQEGNIAYQGNWSNDQFQGKGILYNDNTQMIKGYFDYTDFRKLEEDQWTVYQGQFVESQRNGRGKLTLSNGQLYQGEFINNLPHGSGIFTRSRGGKVKGIWSKGKLKTVID